MVITKTDEKNFYIYVDIIFQICYNKDVAFNNILKAHRCLSLNENSDQNVFKNISVQRFRGHTVSVRFFVYNFLPLSGRSEVFMTKNFGKLFIIFGVLICIFAFVGCDLIFEESSNNEPEEPIVPAEELINQIIEYLIHVSIDHDMPSVSIADKINRIKGGQQLLHIGCDSQSEY